MPRKRKQPDSHYRRLQRTLAPYNKGAKSVDRRRKLTPSVKAALTKAARKQSFHIERLKEKQSTFVRLSKAQLRNLGTSNYTKTRTGVFVKGDVKAKTKGRGKNIRLDIKFKSGRRYDIFIPRPAKVSDAVLFDWIAALVKKHKATDFSLAIRGQAQNLSFNQEVLDNLAKNYIQNLIAHSAMGTGAFVTGIYLIYRKRNA